MEDLIADVIRTGRLDQCKIRLYVQDNCLPIYSFDGEEKGFICAGYCKDVRPVDCIKVCMQSSKGTDFVMFAVSPKESLLLANLLIVAVSGFACSGIIGDDMHNNKGYDFRFLKEQLEN